MIIKHYQLRGNEDSVGALRTALDYLAQKIAAFDGVLGVELFQDFANPACFILVERWQSVEHYAQASQRIDKTAFKAVFAQLGAAPELLTLAAVSANGVDLTA